MHGLNMFCILKYLTYVYKMRINTLALERAVLKLASLRKSPEPLCFDH